MMAPKVSAGWNAIARSISPLDIVLIESTPGGRLLDGEKMSAVCREFGVSRKTGHKIFNRYNDFGGRGSGVGGRGSGR